MQTSMNTMETLDEKPMEDMMNNMEQLMKTMETTMKQRTNQ